MKPLIVAVCFCCSVQLLLAQDTSFTVDNRRFTLPEAIVRNNLDYNKILATIKNDTSFYKSFRNLRVLNFTSYNDIKMFDKKEQTKASLYSKTKQKRANGCRTMEVLEENTTGDFYSKSGGFNYQTAELYASLFFTNGAVCGETNIVGGTGISAKGKSGMEKHKEQLKMLFFNPGKKIPGIPFIGNKLDLYDERAKKMYDYRLDIQEYQGINCYVFTITPKEDTDRGDIVVDEMVTWFEIATMDVLQRSYSLSYKAGVYDFNVTMEVEMQKFDNLIVPRVLRYKGNWDVLFKKRERGMFTATLFDFKKEN